MTFDNLSSASWILAEWGRRVRVPGHLTIPEGLGWYLRTAKGLDPRHVTRAVALLVPKEIPLESGGIDRQIEETVMATRPATTIPRWEDMERWAALLDNPLYRFVYTPKRPAMYHRPKVTNPLLWKPNRQHPAHRGIDAACGGFMPQGSVLTNVRPKHLNRCTKCFREGSR